MTSTSDRPRYSAAEVASIKAGREIHAAVIEDGRRDSEGRTDGTKVFAYLDHDMIKAGQLPFVKYDQRDGKISRRFSKSVASAIKSHVDDLKIYFKYVLDCDRRAPTTVEAKSRREVGAERIAREVDGDRPSPVKVLTNGTDSPPDTRRSANVSD